MNRPVFLLGVGAHKAGTSFLHRALDAHPEVALSRPKEMHVFDAVFLPRMCGQFHRRRCAALAEKLAARPPGPGACPETGSATRAALVAALRAEARGASGGRGRRVRRARALRIAAVPGRRKRLAAMQRHVHMHYDLSEYVAYFREISAGRAVTGDITPSYQMLRAKHFAAIRDLLEPGFDLRVIFLMRDPVERVFSAMRMDDRNGTETEGPAHERFGETFMVAKHRKRTDYPGLIKALEAVFPPERLFFGFYETLFTPETFARLESFLGITGLAPDFDTRVNASPVLRGLPPADIAAARNFYAASYDFCRARFGAGFIDAIWPHAAAARSAPVIWTASTGHTLSMNGRM